MNVDISKWLLKTLGDVCTFKRGLTYPKTEESAVITSNVVLRSNNIDLNTCALVFNELKYLSDLYNIPNERKLVKDSILMCMSNGSSAHIGKVAYIDKDYDYAFGGFMGLIIPNNIDPKFLYYKYRSESFKTFLGKIGNGINITNLKFSSISPLPIYVPTLAEQEVIVRELNALQEMIDGYKAQIMDLDELIESIFNKTFGDISINDMNWEITSMGKLGNFKNGLNYEKGEKGKVLKFIGVGDFQNNKYLSSSSILSTIELESISEEYLLKDEDIVFVRSNGNKNLVGRCLEVFPNGIEVTYSGFCIRFRKTANIINKYLLSVLTDSSFKKTHILKSNGIGIQNINQKLLSNLPIPIPPIELQKKFESQVDSINTQKALLREQLKDAEQLMAERMQYYFS